ncbi:MAG: Flp pilus assembly complex ATPase component TadA, partial [Bdellovibrionales bacterium]|nr:Flp pilus assembly complex ATPase component TadA [Bdellovibrionales bacterium]
QGLRVEDLVFCSSQEARELIPYEKAMEYKILPLGLLELEKETYISIAAANESADLISTIRFITGKRVKIITTKEELILSAIFKTYKGDDKSLIKLSENIQATLPAESPKIDFRSHANNALSFLTQLIDYAVAKEASDIHLIPLRQGAFVKLRIDGKLLDHEEAFADLQILAQIITRIKVLSNLETSNKHKPQEGRFTIPTPSKEVDARVSIMPTIHGEKAVIRLIAPQKTISFNELGLPTALSQNLQKVLKNQAGAIILSGPTGSGKSSSLYAIMHELVNTGLSLVSIEDPVEHISNHISQTSIDPKKGLDYPTCLRTVLRQDPDVILLGEIRDEDSAKTAFDCATTGHLLLTTVHAKDVFEVFLRLNRLGLDNFTIRQAAKIIISQRLIPKLCSRCKVIDLVNTNKLRTTIYKSTGCAACDYSGYHGRTLLVESLYLDNQIKELLCKESE